MRVVARRAISTRASVATAEFYLPHPPATIGFPFGFVTRPTLACCVGAGRGERQDGHSAGIRPFGLHLPSQTLTETAR